MNQKALINGQEYTLIEILPSLDGGQPFIVCEDGRGKRAVCSEPLWCSCALKDAHAAPVHAHSSAQKKIALFLSVFKGREDVYARRYHSTKTGKSGYTPVCKNEWVNGLCDKKKHKCPECPNREFKPLTAEVVKAHLIGRDPLCRDTQDTLLEVPDEVAEALADAERMERNHIRRMFYNKAQYSLDAEDGIEALAVECHSLAPEAVLDLMERHCRLCRALNELPEIQGRRIEAHYLLGQSQKEIAKAEGVSERNVRKSVHKGLEAMRKILKNFQ